MAIVGTAGWFSQAEEIKIRVTNMKDVTRSREYFEELLGLTIAAHLTWQAPYEKLEDGSRVQCGGPLGDKTHYVFKVAEVLKAFKEAERDYGLWEKIPPDQECILISTAAEVVE